MKFPIIFKLFKKTLDGSLDWEYKYDSIECYASFTTSYNDLKIRLSFIKFKEAYLGFYDEDKNELLFFKSIMAEFLFHYLNRKRNKPLKKRVVETSEDNAKFILEKLG